MSDSGTSTRKNTKGNKVQKSKALPRQKDKKHMLSVMWQTQHYLHEPSGFVAISGLPGTRLASLYTQPGSLISVSELLSIPKATTSVQILSAGWPPGPQTTTAGSPEQF